MTTLNPLGAGTDSLEMLSGRELSMGCVRSLLERDAGPIWIDMDSNDSRQNALLEYLQVRRGHAGDSRMVPSSS